MQKQNGKDAKGKHVDKRGGLGHSAAEGVRRLMGAQAFRVAAVLAVPPPMRASCARAPRGRSRAPAGTGSDAMFIRARLLQVYMAAVGAVLRRQRGASGGGTRGAPGHGKAKYPGVPPVQEKKSFLENALRARQLLLQGKSMIVCLCVRVCARARACGVCNVSMCVGGVIDAGVEDGQLQPSPRYYLTFGIPAPEA